MSEHSQTQLSVSRMDASIVADALWDAFDARREEKEARDIANQPDSWDYFGASYFSRIERADQALADALNRVLGER